MSFFSFAAPLTVLALAAGPSSSVFDRYIFQPDPMPRVVRWSGTTAPEEIRVTTADGLLLKGYRWKARCKAHDAMVFFHGNGGNRYTAASLAAPLVRDDVDLIVASYRGYGDNPGKPSEDGLSQDSAAFIAEAKAGAPRKLILFGFSLGGAMAVRHAGQADAVVTLGAFSRLRSVAPKLVRSMLPYEFDNLARTTPTGPPWLLMHGTADTVVPVAEAEKLKTAAGSRATFVRLTNAPHNVALDQVATRIWSALGGMTGNPAFSRPASCPAG